MNARRALAVAAGKTAGAVSRLSGRGGGTALPGLIAERLDPDLVRDLVGQLPEGAICVGATNGKTTTSAMLAAILRTAGFAPLHNRTGSNMMRGLATALLRAAGPAGDLRVRGRAIGLFEVDEAVLPIAARAVRPRCVVLGNLFRDQLDRYGEVDLVAARWRSMVAALDPDATLVFNADDPLVAGIAGGYPRCLGYGVADIAAGHEGLEHAADARFCGRCGAPFAYAVSFYGHLGHYRCPACGLARPAPDVRAERVRRAGMAGSDLTIETPAGAFSFRLPLPGLYNVYNALAATAAATALEIPNDLICRALAGFRAAFGRVERVEVPGRPVWLFLVKNPVGFNEVLRTLFDDGQPRDLLLLLNDNDADGRDVSWIWDVDFEPFVPLIRRATFGGIRAEDMALRLKYAGLPAGRAALEKDLDRALDRALEAVPEGGCLYILPTYTAMLAVRGVLSRRGHVAPYWE